MTPSDTGLVYDAFREIANNIGIIVYSQRPDGTTEWVNRRWYDYTGLPPELAIVPEGWQLIMPPSDFDQLQRAFSHAFAHAERYEFEVRFKPYHASDNEYRWHRVRAEPMYDEHRQLLRFAGSVTDIHDSRSAEEAAQAEIIAREQAEQQLRDAAIQRENEFKALGDSIPQIVWTATADGAIDWYNQEWMAYTGQTQAEAAGWGWQAVHHSDDFPEVMRRWPEAIRTGRQFEMEFRLRGRDGNFRWFLTRIRPYRDETGRVIRWFGTNTDIHEQKQSIAKTQRIVETVQRIFLPESMPQHSGAFFDAVYMPAESDALVGGDWYDAFALADGRILLSIGDVAGHGLDAAVLAGRLRQSIFSEAIDNPEPSAILRKADRLLRAQSETIVTALVAIFTPETGEFRFASAGHPTPIYAAPGEPAQSMPNGSLPLGAGFIVNNFELQTHTLWIANEAVVVFYTDGVTEFARDILKTELVLGKTIERIVARELPDSAKTIYKEVLGQQTATDDVAILLMRRTTEKPQPQASIDFEKTWRFHSSDAHSAHKARLELMTFLKVHSQNENELFEAELIIGELLANAVEHAPGLVEIFVDWRALHPSIKIRDSGPGFELDDAAPPAELFSEDGRGLYLIRTLAKHFTARHAPGYGADLTVVLPLMRELAFV